ncbi:histidine kinase [Maribacter sp. 4U21]|uniref:2TM domain-containing protein n=1 Tax=Maribacter sp. 4U21 TaxID=1889779 RepID=UPI000C15F353|nr:2TM domain-containing protein [Maribacter sp. 4U21]PIB28331.1 histidine kinase [Maribacter sp. 4U21]
MDDRNREDKYFRARERVDQIKKFYSSLLSYIIFIALLGGLNYWIDEWRYPWFLCAAFGWGIGLVFQAVKAFGFNPFFGKDWENRKIKELMENDEDAKKWK